MKFKIIALASLMLIVAALVPVAAMSDAQPVGGVYVMTNDVDSNSVVAFGRSEDGSLTKIGAYSTGGQGAVLDGGEGLDPLISAYALYKTSDDQFLLAANAGSGELTAFMVNDNFSLTITDIVQLGAGYNPLTVASNGSFVYAAGLDSEGVGFVTALTISDTGELDINASAQEQAIEGRPSAVQVSPDGRFLVVGVLTTGMIRSYTIGDDGALTFVNEATSTVINNAEGRNLPTPVGFEIRQSGDNTFAVVTEAREIQPNGDDPAGDLLQTGSVSVFAIDATGTISHQSSVLAGDDIAADTGEITTCWIAFSEDGDYFWAANQIEASISTFSFDAETGAAELLNAAEFRAEFNPGDLLPPNAFAQTEGFVDMFVSADGQYLYQLYGLTGKIGIFRIADGSLEHLGDVADDAIPTLNSQGIVAF